MGDEYAYDFGSIEVAPRKGRPPSGAKLVQFSVAKNALDKLDSAAILQILQQAGGDISIFLTSFPTELGTKEQVLARVLYIVAQNSDAQKGWDLLVRCHREAKMALAERDALEELENMPVPNDKTPLDGWIRYATFWTGAYKEGHKTKERVKATTKTEPTDDLPQAAIQALQAIEKAKG